MTETRAVLGSRAYMAPEQMRSPRDVDARADVWALGAILYYLVTGKAPFAGETAEASILLVAHGTPPPIAETRPETAAGFERVVLRCLAKARRDRWANVVELARALAPFTRDDGLPAEDRATVPIPRPTAPSSPSTRAVALTTSALDDGRPSVEKLRADEGAAARAAGGHPPPARLARARVDGPRLGRDDGAPPARRRARPRTGQPRRDDPLRRARERVTAIAGAPPSASSAAPRNDGRLWTKPPMVTCVP